MHKKILAFAGSVRKDSYNKKLLDLVVRHAPSHQLDVTVIDLKDYALPFYDADTEAANGLPEAAHALKSLFLQHDGLLIASPEYNSALSPLLKNMLDWVSRKASEEEAPLSAYQGKSAALLSASPGYFGGIRGLVGVRSILSSINVHVIPEQLCVPMAHEILDDEAVFEQKYKTLINNLLQSLWRHTHAR